MFEMERLYKLYFIYLLGEVITYGPLAISVVTDSLALAFLKNTLLRITLDFLEQSDRFFQIFPLE